MARKSRRPGMVSESEVLDPEYKIYRTALYLRLSVLDTQYKTTSESLANQQALLESYVEQQPALQVVRIFTDNGETGTNFQRPAWNELVQECHAGKLDCVIVKDLSRFGRNFIETSDYLDTIFPAMGIRFIALNDHYDSLTATTNDKMAFGIKNLVNDMYAKDISKKSSSALQQKQKNGDFIGSYAAYGYLKRPDDKNKIMVDEETAPVVRQIFKWKAEDLSLTAICRKLNDREISSPCKYRLEKGILKDERYRTASWAPATIRTMLKSPVYIGHMAQGKHIGPLCEGKGRKRSSASEWIIVENTHTPIVDKELYDTVQKKMAERTAVYNSSKGRYAHFSKPENLFDGLLFCADCGKPMYRYKSVTSNGKYVTWVYLCRTHTLYLDKGCPKKYLHEKTLVQLVQNVLVEKINEAANLNEIITRLNRSGKYKSNIKKQNGELEELNSKLLRIQSLRMSAYEDFKGGLLDKEEYQFAIAKYDADAVNIKSRIDTVKEVKEHFMDTCSTSNKHLEAFRQISGREDPITRDLLLALVQKIVVSSDDQIEIIWNFKDEYEALQQYINEEKEVANE